MITRAKFGAGDGRAIDVEGRATSPGQIAVLEGHAGRHVRRSTRLVSVGAEIGEVRRGRWPSFRPGRAPDLGGADRRRLKKSREGRGPGRRWAESRSRADRGVEAPGPSRGEDLSERPAAPRTPAPRDSPRFIRGPVGPCDDRRGGDRRVGTSIEPRRAELARGTWLKGQLRRSQGRGPAPAVSGNWPATSSGIPSARMTVRQTGAPGMRCELSVTPGSGLPVAMSGMLNE